MFVVVLFDPLKSERVIKLYPQPFKILFCAIWILKSNLNNYQDQHVRFCVVLISNLIQPVAFALRHLSNQIIRLGSVPA